MKKIPILYYREGWRAGWLVTSGRKWVRIRVIPPYGCKPSKRCIRVLTSDTKPVGHQYQGLGNTICQECGHTLNHPIHVDSVHK